MGETVSPPPKARQRAATSSERFHRVRLRSVRRMCMKRVAVMAFAYGISAFMDCTIAASRGLGKTVIPTVIVVLGSCVDVYKRQRFICTMIRF